MVRSISLQTPAARTPLQPLKSIQMLRMLPPSKRDRELMQEILRVQDPTWDEERVNFLLEQLVALKYMPKVWQ